MQIASTQTVCPLPNIQLKTQYKYENANSNLIVTRKQMPKCALCKSISLKVTSINKTPTKPNANTKTHSRPRAHHPVSIYVEVLPAQKGDKSLSGEIATNKSF